MAGRLARSLEFATLQATLQGVYAAALYRYASGTGDAAPGFSADLMAQAFRTK